MIIHHIKEKGKPAGCMLAIVNDDEFFIGMSKCSPDDIYKKNIAVEIALGRSNECMKKNKVLYKVLPKSWHKKYTDFFERSVRYFKDKNPSYSSIKCYNMILKK